MTRKRPGRRPPRLRGRAGRWGDRAQALARLSIGPLLPFTSFPLILPCPL